MASDFFQGSAEAFNVLASRLPKQLIDDYVLYVPPKVMKV